jgi:hypothetical protein
MSDSQRTSNQRYSQARLIDELNDYDRSMPVAVWEGICKMAADEIKRLQAQVDALMLEHCPKEMTAAQLQLWAASQRPVVEPETEPCPPAQLPTLDGEGYKKAGPTEPPTGALNVAPIANVTLSAGEIIGMEIYAPGLPDGRHELFPVPLNPNGAMQPFMGSSEPPSVSRHDELVQWVKRNADHADSCTGFMVTIKDDGTEEDWPCTCGLRDLIPDFDGDFTLADNSGSTKSAESP